MLGPDGNLPIEELRAAGEERPQGVQEEPGAACGAAQQLTAAGFVACFRLSLIGVLAGGLGWRSSSSSSSSSRFDSSALSVLSSLKLPSSIVLFSRSPDLMLRDHFT